MDLETRRFPDSFLGVSIVADIFMCAIEKITSKTKKIHIAGSGDDEEEVIEVPVWNGTVANLTLMALGKTFNNNHKSI